MSVEKMIKLTRSDDQSITVTFGTDTFTIAFFEVPRVSDNAERRFQRVREPRADVNETKETNTPGPHNFPFTIYGSPTEDDAKDKKKEKQGSGSHFLAIKDDKAFAIRIVGDCKESAFKVKVRVGGVNVLQHTTFGRKSQDYFVVSEQKWIWGKQVGKDTARQFRVLRRGRERLSLRYQLRNNNIKKEVEIKITSRRLALPTGSSSYFPPASTGMTSAGPDFGGLCATHIPVITRGMLRCIMLQQVHHSTPPPSLFDADHFKHLSSDDKAPTPQVAFQELPSNNAGLSTPDSHGIVPPGSPLLTTSHEPDSEDFLVDEEFFDTMPYGDTTPASLQGLPQAPQIHRFGPPSRADPTEVVISSSSDDTPSSSQSQQISQAPASNDTDSSNSSLQYMSGVPTISYRPSLPARAESVLRPPAGVELVSLPPSLVSETRVHSQAIIIDVTPQPASNQESIHSDLEEDMLPHQMVVGTGGLIEQIVCPDKHPELIDGETVTLKFKIVDDPRYLPKHLQNLAEPEETAVGGMRIRGTGPGGNYHEVPNPPTGTFRALAPVVTDPDGLRRDIRSPMEMELSVDGHGEPLEPPEDSGDGSVGERDEGGRATDDGGDDGDARGFQVLWGEAENQPRGLMNDIRMKKKRREQRKRGGVGMMAEKREEPKSERSSRWRRFVDALRRVLTLAR
ncbi:hypothetical protein GE21DRAFT_5510 [Neurospora crassa]|uniref:Uncharacterized protein n=1 Tax=Neurospora crassa (strain ATCC 24698 / 74-OR23-1A / CBS 708.71 / DSM 1257 / FGSC 987) TaxID=367110 RepID=Q7SA12_NEUCR|nr:hypothetical protein NCU07905 [Neurospora crassa OR74A]EAA33185.2 hypothetical protein NCU07905 [Neurospora crassa OR74A]KHE85861.1 hypothetical protein GE21DRAFT_5510 [Neurospora crassa]|eukprot:XP_962421.2 hypothetical protein NCU07905 [Neurospora crassa OR74A]